MEVIVYSKSGCPECVFTKKFLEEENILYKEKRVDQNKAYLDEVIELGFSSLPVVKIGDQIFSGYQPDKLQTLV
ncbi:MAG: glutaredoxin family protein [Amphibacillus sp.]|uniref:Glutaredoxin-like protein NrdH n=1 Tax=Amphibacillus xylanus (strain ATCC 51415 / DSM 6626 / JCM 7361 / LMG 17667 / NBRC 15112 / Ep01) TaxID=698758 RepID=K0J7I3_AMPXN|nr:glutaredoxin family protein [Amphibacillus xylanus]NMA90352.1 glutaredoxin family protein [Amphibacillus sp.]BAM47438.1 glutaredoxin-like protein NrdH [Amphibacillus xylanus NBRC 15112]